MEAESKHESSGAVMVHLAPPLLAEVEAYSAKEGISLDTFIGTASAELIRRRKEEEWYARPRHSTPEGRARAIAIVERNAAVPAEPCDALSQVSPRRPGNASLLACPTERRRANHTSLHKLKP